MIVVLAFVARGKFWSFVKAGFKFGLGIVPVRFLLILFEKLTK